MKKPEQLSKLDITIAVLAVGMLLYHLIQSRTLFMGYIEQQNIHLMFALMLVFLSTLKKKKRFWPWILLLIVVSLVTTVYIQVFHDDLLVRKGLPTVTDIVIGILLLVAVFEATRQSFGKVLPIVGLIFIAYVALGQYLPRPFWHFPIDIDLAISSFNMAFKGMFGMALGVSANYMFLFIMFGAFLRASGTMRFLTQVGLLVGKKLAGGVGMTAVVSSALVGMLLGAGTANVAVTGPVTIPFMKRAGYSSEQAGAIETVASIGGQIMPPMMGIVAFLMAEYIGVPYTRIAVMAIIPAVLYYFCVTMFVRLNAAKLKVARIDEEVNIRDMLRFAHLFFIPVALLIVLLSQGYSLMLVAFIMPISVFLIAMVRKDTRGSFATWLKACVEGAATGAGLAVAMALIGTVMASIDLTGIGILFPAMVGELAGGSLWIALLLVAFITILLGCGLPPMAAYLTVAMLCASVLTKLGMPLIQTHFYLFFFAVFALMTPPIGPAALVASVIAGGNYLKTCLESVKAGVIAWILPFLVFWIPGIVLQPQEPLEMATMLLASFISVLFLQVSLVGYYLTDLSRRQRGLSLLSVAALISFIATGNYILLSIGLIIGILLTLWQLRQRRLNKTNSQISEVY